MLKRDLRVRNGLCPPSVSKILPQGVTPSTLKAIKVKPKLVSSVLGAFSCPQIRVNATNKLFALNVIAKLLLQVVLL